MCRLGEPRRGLTSIGCRGLRVTCASVAGEHRAGPQRWKSTYRASIESIYAHPCNCLVSMWTWMRCANVVQRQKFAGLLWRE